MKIPPPIDPQCRREAILGNLTSEAIRLPIVSSSSHLVSLGAGPTATSIAELRETRGLGGCMCIVLLGGAKNTPEVGLMTSRSWASLAGPAIIAQDHSSGLLSGDITMSCDWSLLEHPFRCISRCIFRSTLSDRGFHHLPCPIALLPVSPRFFFLYICMRWSG